MYSQVCNSNCLDTNTPQPHTQGLCYDCSYVAAIIAKALEKRLWYTSACSIMSLLVSTIISKHIRLILVVLMDKCQKHSSIIITALPSYVLSHYMHISCQLSWAPLFGALCVFLCNVSSQKGPRFYVRLAQTKVDCALYVELGIVMAPLVTTIQHVECFYSQVKTFLQCAHIQSIFLKFLHNEIAANKICQ